MSIGYQPGLWGLCPAFFGKTGPRVAFYDVSSPFVAAFWLAVFLPIWKGALRLKEIKGWKLESRVGSRTGENRGRVSDLPWAWYLASAVLVLIGLPLSIVRYAELPALVAGHLGPDFRPTYFVEKTWGSVLLMSLMAIGILAIMMMVAVFIQRVKLQVDPHAEAISFAQHRVYRRRMGQAMGFLTLSVSLLMSICTLAFLFPESPLPGPWAFPVGMALVGLPPCCLSLST